ncbi:MAG: LCP family protein [Spirochaetaceae bacterium]|jgi:anionic cell wall polymer biosynthesis LytR-Cps2A-Psr (LCP) family protein|nr:LCP family protein [Spirochaetaceae bacterium]
MNKNRFVAKEGAKGLLIGIFVLIAAGIGGSFFLVRSATLDDSLSGDRMVSTLFIIENNGKPLGSYVFFCYPNTRRGALFDIPQNVGLIIRALNRVDRIDSVYDPSRTEEYRREVEGLFGISLPYWMVIDMNGLRSLVDLLDGIEINIPEAIADFTQTPPVLLPAGRVILDGDKAQSYINYDTSDNDAQRIWTKREGFFLGLIKRIGEKQTVLANNEIKKYFYASLKTSMPPRTIDRLFEMLSGVDTDRVTAQTIEGNYRDVSGERLLFPSYDGDLIKDIVRETLHRLSLAAESASDDRVQTVEVLNGTSTAGLAGRTAELLRGFGYDVITVDNADNTEYEETLVIDRSGDDELGTRFADITRCKNIRREPSQANTAGDGIGMLENNYEIKADFTLILGWDFNGRYANQ